MVPHQEKSGQQCAFRIFDGYDLTLLPFCRGSIKAVEELFGVADNLSLFLQAQHMEVIELVGRKTEIGMQGKCLLQLPLLVFGELADYIIQVA